MKLKNLPSYLLVFVVTIASSTAIHADKAPEPDTLNFTAKLLAVEKVTTKRDKKDVHIYNELRVEILSVSGGWVNKGQIVLCHQRVSGGDSKHDEIANPKVGTTYRIHAIGEFEKVAGVKEAHLDGCELIALPKEKKKSK
jgi:hypothetical protein